MQSDDLSLVQAILKGDEDAFRRLTEKYQRAVFNIAWRMVRNDEDARDLTQEAFIRVYRGLSTYDQNRTFSTWLFRIATNLCIDFHRKKKMRTVSIDGSQTDDEMREPMALPDPGPKTDRLHEVTSLAERVDALMESLPVQYKMALHLRYREQLSYEEMADVLGIPLGTVKARLHRAHKQMRNMLEGDA